MLDKLPDEIAVEIVNICAEPRPFTHATLDAPPLHKSKSYEALKWSHVSRRFRSLTRTTSTLWTWISSAMHPEFIQECLKLSGGNALDVEIRAEQSNTEVETLQVLLQPSSSTRWVNLLMRINLIEDYPHEDQTEEESMEIVYNHYIDLSGLQLPNLSRLCLVYELEENEAFTIALEWSTKWFAEMYSTWSAPSIHEVVTNGDDLPSTLANSLRKLTVSLHTIECIADFRYLTSAFTSVQELCIRSSIKQGRLREAYGRPCCMPSVSVLRLEWDIGDYWAANDINIFLAWIELPNLSALHIVLSMHGVSDVAAAAAHNAILNEDCPLDALLYEPQPSRKFRYPKVSTFELHVVGVIAALPINSSLPLHEFDELQHLILKGISAESFSSGDTEDWKFTPRDLPSTLQTITLEDCNGITTKDVAPVLEAFRKEIYEEDGGEKRLRPERVTIVRCKNVNLMELATLSNDTKIFYVPG